MTVSIRLHSERVQSFRQQAFQMNRQGHGRAAQHADQSAILSRVQVFFQTKSVRIHCHKFFLSIQRSTKRTFVKLFNDPSPFHMLIKFHSWNNQVEVALDRVRATFVCTSVLFSGCAGQDCNNAVWFTRDVLRPCSSQWASYGRLLCSVF